MHQEALDQSKGEKSAASETRKERKKKKEKGDDGEPHATCVKRGAGSLTTNEFEKRLERLTRAKKEEASKTARELVGDENARFRQNWISNRTQEGKREGPGEKKKAEEKVEQRTWRVDEWGGNFPNEGGSAAAVACGRTKGQR